MDSWNSFSAGRPGRDGSLVRWRRRRRIRAVPAVALLLFGMAGCMGFPQVDTASPPSKVGTFSDPVIVTRDNLAVGGEVYVSSSADYFKTVAGTVGSDTTYLSQAKWSNAKAYTKIEEFRAKWGYLQKGSVEQGWVPKEKFQDFYSPVLPRTNFFAPGLAKYGTRAGVMVHGNVYRVSATGEGGGNSPQTASARHVKLSDDVPVVPVVVVSWRNPSAAGYIDQTFPAAGAIDFYPAASLPQDPLPYYNDNSATWVGAYTLQSPTIDQSAVHMAWSDYVPNVPCPWGYPWVGMCDGTYDHWTPDFAKYRPNGRWTPPDDIWTQCNVQFQIVDAVTLDLPKGWVADCNAHALDTPNIEMAYTAHYAGTGWEAWSKYVVEDLDPVFVSFADFECPDWHGITKPGVGGRRIEIDNHAPDITLAHELGHTIGLPEYTGLQVGNVMISKGDAGPNVDVAAQCSTAHSAAKAALSPQFDEFNRVTGRTYSLTSVPSLEDLTSDPPAEEDPGEIEPGPAGHCCLLADASDVTVSQQACTTMELPFEKCTVQCCSNSEVLTAYKCETLGFTSYYCPPS